MLGVAQVDDGALQADRARAAVEDEVDGFAQLGGDVLGGGRADPARRVGARGDDGQPDLAQERLGRRVRRHPDGHGREAGGGGRGDLRRAASGRTSVSGPGQNASASRSARASKAAMRRAASRRRRARSAGCAPGAASPGRRPRRRPGRRRARRGRRRSRSGRRRGGRPLAAGPLPRWRPESREDARQRPRGQPSRWRRRARPTSESAATRRSFTTSPRTNGAAPSATAFCGPTKPASQARPSA